MRARLWALGVVVVLGGCTVATPPSADPVPGSTRDPAGAQLTDPAVRVSGPIVMLSARVSPDVQWVEVDEPQGTAATQADRHGVGGGFDGDTVRLDPFPASVGHHDYWFVGHTVFPGEPGDRPTSPVHLGVDVAPEGGPTGEPVPPSEVGRTPGCSTDPPPASPPASLTLTGAEPQLLYVNVVEPDCTLGLFTPVAGGSQPSWSDTFPVTPGDGSVWVGERLAVYEGIPFHGETLQGRFIVAFEVTGPDTVVRIP